MDNKKINLQYTTFNTPLPDFIHKGIEQYSKNANGYKPQPTELLEKLANKHNVSQESIFLTAGADEAINLFALAFAKKAYFFTPTYVVYSEVENFYAHITPINALKNNLYTISTQTIPDATLIYLANPNNPFGSTPKEKVLELVTNNRQAIIVIDEVYAEFANLSVIRETRKYPNLAVIRSFSKSYGMAGNRIGFIVAHPDSISKVKTKAQWANVSYLSVGAAVTALDNENYFTQMINDIITRREQFSQFLKNKGFFILPSSINCVLIKFSTENDGTKFVQYINNNNFVVSHGNGNSNIGLDKSFVRISIGTQSEMEAIQETIEKYKEAT